MNEATEIYEVQGKLYFNKSDAYVALAEAKEKEEDKQTRNKIYIHRRMLFGFEEPKHRTKFGYQRYDHGAWRIVQSVGMGDYESVTLGDADALKLAENIYSELGKIPGDLLRELAADYVDRLTEEANKFRNLLS